MSEAVHDIAHEATHEAAHSGTGHAKLIGLLISVLALFLAVSEMLGKSAQTHGLALNIEASDRSARDLGDRENRRRFALAGSPEAIFRLAGDYRSFGE